MFEIALLPPHQLGPDGQRLGRIRIGDFSERFACHAVDGMVDSLPIEWRSALCRLVDGARCVALVHDPRFAWLVYRDRDICFVQQKLSLDGSFDVDSPRETVAEDVGHISEWATSIGAICQFLAAN